MTEQTTAIVNWEDELAKQADAAAASEVSGGGQFFSVKGGVLQFDGQAMPGNQAAVIILDSIFENVYYDGPYDPDEPQGPVCFAFNHVAEEMAPHDLVVQGKGSFAAQNDTCDGCPMNEFGTADRGKGKACRNTRRLAIIPAGSYDNKGNLELFDDVDHFKSVAIAYMKLPVTSVKGYATFVKQMAGVLRRPPHGILTRVSVTPDPKSQFKVNFEAIDKVPGDLMQVIMDRHAEAKTLIDFPYTPTDPEAKAKAAQPAKKRKY